MTHTRSATAVAPANIAFIKYWGMRDVERTLPYNGSISMNLDACLTTTTVTFDPQLAEDELTLRLYAGPDNAPPARRAAGQPLERVSRQLDRLRGLAGVSWRARVDSANNFPSDAGIASSAAGFSALTLAAAAALGLAMDERELSLWTRRSGSGSACRSIPTGYAEWRVPDGPFDAARWDAESYAVSLAPPEHWALADVVAVVDAGVKKIGSAENHQLAATSPYFPTRLVELPDRLAATREAVAQRDLELLGETMEADAVSMHVVCMTSRPPSFYWNSGTMTVIHAVRAWRAEGLRSYFTIDAGSNVHVICAASDRAEVKRRLAGLPGVQFVIGNGVGPGARIVDTPSP
ncbi:MAG TPA: diphosphomevalonate decarboxylase [Roseiflexaceae bacterium]|nr:diphosphomevalonate decarboxylase [Roseiflexaceae bacterium]